MIMIKIREMIETDADGISAAFLAQGWQKPAALYKQYFQESRAGTRTVLLAEHHQQFAGYVTIVWESDYPAFLANSIPEIVDFNVLIKNQRQGIGQILIETAEQRVAQRSEIVGIGVGLTQDYGAAQILYVKRGYTPDGLGIYQQGKHLKYGDQAQVDDDLTLYFTKKLHSTK
jgi:GNAT superfamily N-acetyltransferase